MRWLKIILQRYLGTALWLTFAAGASLNAASAVAGHATERKAVAKRKYSPGDYLQKKVIAREDVGGAAAEEVNAARAEVEQVAVEKIDKKVFFQYVECDSTREAAACDPNIMSCATSTSEGAEDSAQKSSSKESPGAGTDPINTKEVATAVVRKLRTNCRPIGQSVKPISIEFGMSVEDPAGLESTEPSALDVANRVGAKVGVRAKF